MKNDALMQLKDQARFYISTPERAAEALLFVKNLERFAEEIKEKVKARAVEIMDKKGVESIPYSILDEETGEVREWMVSRAYATELKEYRAENVIEAIGIEDAMKFFKVKNTDLKKFLTTQSAQKKITMEQVEKAVSDPIITTRKGAGVILKEVKAKV